MRKRSPKLPIVTPRTRSPGESVLTTAASIAPVPEDVRTYRSFSVWKARLRLAVVRRSISANSTPRWSIICLLIASYTSGGTGVGPGSRRLAIGASSQAARRTLQE